MANVHLQRITSKCISGETGLLYNLNRQLSLDLNRN